jgi:regulator of nucleoside diphosphate kinase
MPRFESRRIIMSERPIEITSSDAQRLRHLLAYLERRPRSERAVLQRLRHEVERAHIVAPHEVGRRVVTLQTRVMLLDVDTRESATWVLVYPEHADYDAGRLSVLAPIGMAILGYREGDIVEWDVPAGQRRIRIHKVLYQPEAAGHEHLKYSVGGMDHAYRLPPTDPSPEIPPRVVHQWAS